MTEVCHAVMREGITAYIEHTGSGTMTLYAGSRVHDVWTVAAGPGRFLTAEGETDATALTQAQREVVGNTLNFHVGSGQHAAGDPILVSGGHVWTCPELATVAEATMWTADEIIHQVREHDVQTCVVTPEVKTWPETDPERDAFTDWQYEVSQGDTVLGFRDWLAAEKERDVDQS